MFGIGVPELILILVIGLIIFGPGKLPAIGGALGKSLREFKSAFSGDSGSGKNETASAPENKQAR